MEFRDKDNTEVYYFERKTTRANVLLRVRQQQVRRASVQVETTAEAQRMTTLEGASPGFGGPNSRAGEYVKVSHTLRNEYDDLLLYVYLPLCI